MRNWSRFLILSSLLSACASSNYDITSATDREAMKVEINNALTLAECGKALDLSKQLYDSVYTDNSIRMLYASALACNSGIKLYSVLNEMVSFGAANPLGQFARVFPSALTDQKLESGWLAIDALQSILKSGIVIGAADQILPTTYNPGSVLSSDRTLDSNVFSLFVSMSVIGNTLSRYGAPDASYGNGVELDTVWANTAAVQADTSGSACGLASAFLNFFDAFDAVSSILPSSAKASMTTMISAIRTPIEGTTDNTSPFFLVGGNASCIGTVVSVGGVYSQAVCDLAKTRLRYRASCTESDAIARFAFGMIKSISSLWI